MMKTQDLQTLAEIGRAIWGDPEFSRKTTLETMAAVSLLDLTPERSVERAATALLERAAREGSAGNTHKNMSSFGLPFYRLSAEDRFLLVALHLGRWSYERVARVLEEPVDRIEELVWSARLRLLAFFPGAKAYPSGSTPVTPYCPEYVSARPWTQRFLDEEIHSGSERLFLQNHLMACDSCRATLVRCREVYFTVEKLIPREDSLEQVTNHLTNTCNESYRVRGLIPMTVVESLKRFIRRPEVMVALVVLAAILFWKV